MQTTDTDRLIMHLLAQDDEKALRIVFDSYFNRLAGFAVHFVRDREIAREITHDAILRFWEKRHGLSSDSKVLSYLLKTIRNLSLNYLRNLQRSGFSVNTGDNWSDDFQLHYDLLADSVWEQLLASELELVIQKAIQELPDRCREVFTLSRMENLSHAEIAQKLNISLKTIEGHISEALKNIRRQIIVFLVFVLSFMQ